VSVPVRSAAIESAWVVDRYVLFDERDGVVHELNPSASAVWELIDGARPLSAIAAEVSALVGADVSESVATALAEFRDAGLLEPSLDDRACG